MSPRTAKYVDAVIREGDNFDYIKWLVAARADAKSSDEREIVNTSDRSDQWIKLEIATPSSLFATKSPNLDNDVRASILEHCGYLMR